MKNTHTSQVKAECLCDSCFDSKSLCKGGINSSGLISLQKGTPKTLTQAINNGLSDPSGRGCVKTHLKDFLAQKFNVAMIENEDNTEVVEALKSLFERITKE